MTIVSLRLHFISGLPRSGSSLLAAILRQNPSFHAAMSGPLSGIVSALLRSMGTANEFFQFMTDDQRQRILRAACDAYYADLAGKTLVFDTSREWCAQLPLVAQLFPQAKVLCSVRSPAWILDSVERRIQASPFLRGRMFPHDAADNVYTRAKYTVTEGILSAPLQAFRQAWFSEESHRLITIRYDSLTEQPAVVIRQLYALLEQPPFAHDFDRLSYDEPEFDRQFGMPGLHRVRRQVKPNRRITILPPDIFLANDCSFWDIPAENTRGVIVL
jgi:sulfotransferase